MKTIYIIVASLAAFTLNGDKPINNSLNSPRAETRVLAGEAHSYQLVGEAHSHQLVGEPHCHQLVG